MATPDFSKVWASNSPLPPYTFSDADYLTGWDFVGAAPPTKTEFDAWFKMVDEKLNWLYGQLQSTAAQIYPVGSVYISFNSTNPHSLFGGTWTRLKDTFLLANGDNYAANTTGGTATKTIATTNLPAHKHTVNSAGSHNHTATTASAGTHNHSASTASAGTHNHTASTASNGNHTHTLSGTTGAAGSHSHTRGTFNITGQFPLDHNNAGSQAFTGAFSKGVNAEFAPNQGGVGGVYCDFDASKSWSGKTNTVADHTHTFSATTSSNGAHTHTVTVNNAGAHTHTVSVNNNGSHTHTVTVNNNGSHTHTTNNTGGGLPLNIMPPYTTVYMWKRTA